MNDDDIDPGASAEGVASRPAGPGRVARLVRRSALLALLAAVLAVVLFAGGAAFSFFYAQYGYHPAENAASWAALAPVYADTTVCRSCHADQYERWTGSHHAGVVCESCHGPLAAHAANPSVAAKVVDPTDQACTACHQRIVGRPTGFPQVVLAEHYAGTTCLQCHNAHTTRAETPARITHMLMNPPECLSCHGPNALQPFPVGHVVAADGVCLGCHKPAEATP